MPSPTFRCHQKSVSTSKPRLAMKTPATRSAPSMAGNEKTHFRSSVGVRERSAAGDTVLAGLETPSPISKPSGSCAELLFRGMAKSWSLIVVFRHILVNDDHLGRAR